MPTLPSEEFDRRLDRLRTTADSGWKLAQQRESIIRDLLYADGPMAERVTIAAETLGVSERTVRRFIGRYRVWSQTTSLVPKVRGPNQKCRRLGAARERLVDEAIQTHYLIRPKPPMEEAYCQIVH
jgi:hypothetical protein